MCVCVCVCVGVRVCVCVDVVEVVVVVVGVGVGMGVGAVAFWLLRTNKLHERTLPNGLLTTLVRKAAPDKGNKGKGAGSHSYGA